MKRILERTVESLAVHAGRSRTALARVERVAVHALVVLYGIDHWRIVAAGLRGVVRELKGI
jgi:hypothetical protein